MGSRRHVLTAQQNILEVRCGPPGDISFQCYGHHGRVSCADLVQLTGDRLGVISGSADQTLRLWQARLPAAPDDEEGEEDSGRMGLEEPNRLTLLTPARTLRGHTESLTCLQVITGSTGVCIAATGGKERVLKLWGLAPLLPSPVHQPQIATLRGHGAPVTCLAPISEQQQGRPDSGAAGVGAAAGADAAPAAALVSGSLDARLKLWDVWNPACISTAKLPAPITQLGSIVDPLGLAPGALAQHAVLAAAGNAVHLLDVRSMRTELVAAQPERAEQVLCMAAWGTAVATGGRDGAARVWDLRMTAGAGAQQEPRLVLRDYRRQVSSIHMDRLKVVASTDEYGEAPLRVWDALSGRLLARLGSAPSRPCGTASGGGATRDLSHSRWPAGPASLEGAAAGGLGGGQGSAEAGEEGYQDEPAAGSDEEAREGWEGVTALACRGAVLVTGNSEGLICERDYRRGGLHEAGASCQLPQDGEVGVGEGVLGKFWRAADIH
ncbi:hypothetical protein N2152v2_002468 [Parachlorella kessleri]